MPVPGTKNFPIKKIPTWEALALLVGVKMKRFSNFHRNRNYNTEMCMWSKSPMTLTITDYRSLLLGTFVVKWLLDEFQNLELNERTGKNTHLVLAISMTVLSIYTFQVSASRSKMFAQILLVRKPCKYRLILPFSPDQ